MNVYVVVLNWNGKDLIAKCLKSLEKQSIPTKIVVIDNGSTDGSIEIIELQFPKVELIKKSKNYGFAGGVNIGIKHAIKSGADYIALFNNDAVAEAHWLENLIKTAEENPKAGIVTSKLIRSDKKHLDSSGDFYTIWGMPFPRGRNLEDKDQFNEQEEVFGASGGASLYQVEMLEEIELFDEKFFAYFEDVDISFRARLADWKIIYNPKAVAYHEVSATSSRMVNSFTRYHSIKNLLILYTKNMPSFLYFKYLPLFTLQMTRLAVSSLAKDGLWVYLRGVFRFLIWLPGILRDRWKIQKSRKVSVRTIDALLVHSRPPKIPKI